MSERWKLVLLVAAFALAFFLPIESPRMQGARSWPSSAEEGC